MDALSAFAIAFFFSFVGTLPPGSLNLTVIQLGLNRRMNTAIRMSVAAAIVEYPYAWLAVEFQELISRSLDITQNFKLFGSLVMIALGALNLLSTVKSSSNRISRLQENGFRAGVVLGVLNPLAIPFWIAMTAYLKSRGWVTLSNGLELHSYLLGVSTGTLAVFVVLAWLARRIALQFKTNALLPKLPGALLIALGVYAFGEYMFR
jgi:threonine/homoserine/homoserine lactone efflux protein